MTAQVTAQPTLRFGTDASRPSPASVGVRGLDPDLVARLGEGTQAGDLLRFVLRVKVVQPGKSPEAEAVPDVSGRYQVLENEVRFVPHFPFERGVKYRASFDPRPLGDLPPGERLTLKFSLPRKRSATPPEVAAIFPTRDTLPENLLRFYVRFSHPMRRGRVAEQITLLGPDGHPAPDVLYRAPVELWDRTRRHLTILLDPGRLKRGVGPHVELGPPLKAGQEYTLAVGPGMLDDSGRPLGRGLCKRFRVTGAVREPVAVERWKIVLPPTGSRQPLALLFPSPLDWAMLWQAITIGAADGLAVDGRVAVGHGEKRWSFTPRLPWAAGDYHVRVAPGLEDICGNNIVAAFDGPLQSGSHLARETADRSLAFHLGGV